MVYNYLGDTRTRAATPVFGGAYRYARVDRNQRHRNAVANPGQYAVAKVQYGVAKVAIDCSKFLVVRVPSA